MLPSNTCVDLVITTNDAHYKRTFTLQGETKGENGCGDGNKFGKVFFVKRAGHQGADFDFKFQKTSDKSEVTMSSVGFAFLDIDGGNPGKQDEKVTVSGLSSYSVPSTSKLTTTVLSSTSVSFQSNPNGGSIDNPANPLSLTTDMKNAAVQTFFKNTKGFTVRFEMVGAAGFAPRGLFFAGISNILPACTGSG